MSVVLKLGDDPAFRVPRPLAVMEQRARLDQSEQLEEVPPATRRKYEQLRAKLDHDSTFKRVDAEQIWGVKKSTASDLIRELRDARLLEDAGGLEYTYRLKDAAGERVSMLPDPEALASGP